MTNNPRDGAPASPALSVVIPVFNRWRELDRCLRALDSQEAPPSFEVIVIDDGSDQPAPAHLADAFPGLALTIVRQRNSGPGAARNTGLQIARGAIVAFFDSDVVVVTTYLRAVVDAAAAHPGDGAFQSSLSSCGHSMTHRAEGMRLGAVQQVTHQPGGRIAYANTSAFSVRRKYAERFPAFFDPGARRGEDTLVLARMAREGELPRFVPTAVAVHLPPGSLAQYIARHWHIGVLTREARETLARIGGVRLSSRGRLRMLGVLLQRSAANKDPLALALTLIAYALELCGRTYAQFPVSPRAHL